MIRIPTLLIIFFSVHELNIFISKATLFFTFSDRHLVNQSVWQSVMLWGNMIFSAAIKYRQLDISMGHAHLLYAFIWLSICRSCSKRCKQYSFKVLWFFFFFIFSLFFLSYYNWISALLLTYVYLSMIFVLLYLCMMSSLSLITFKNTYLLVSTRCLLFLVWPFLKIVISIQEFLVVFKDNFKCWVITQGVGEGTMGN